MRINYSCIYWLFIVLLAFQSASGQNEIADRNTQNILVSQSDTRIENLKKQVSELFEAYDKGNIDIFSGLTYPKVFEKDGGRKNFVQVFKDVVEFNSNANESFHSSVESPSELIEIDNQLFAVTPYKLEAIRKETIR